MALVRVTPETAIETVQQLVRDFREAVDGAGRAPALEKLRQQADDLLVLIEAVAVEVEVMAIDLAPQWAAVVAQWLGADAEELAAVASDGKDVRADPKFIRTLSVVRMHRGRLASARQVGERVPPVLVVAHSAKEAPGEEVIEEIVHEIKRRPLTLIAAPEGSDWAQALAGLGSRDAWICKFMDLESLAMKDLEGSLTRPPWQQAGQLACGWSVAGALSAMHSAFAVVLENEGRSLQSKRAALEQQAAAGMRLAETATPTDVLGEVRSYIQKQFDGFSKGLIGRMEGLVAPHEGSLRLEIEAGINSIEDFEYTKKPKVFAVKIPPAIQNGLIRRIKDTLAEAGRQDVQQLRLLLQEVRSNVESMVTSKGGPPVTVHFDPVEQQTFDKILSRAIHLQRPYSGELVRKGPLDFFMQARRYSMMFFMVLSAFGLSFVRQYKEFTVPLTILLLTVGLLNVVNQARKQAAENKEKELNKAKDSLRSDLGRGMQDVQKNWSQTVSGHLQAAQSETLEAIERAVKAAAAEISREATEKKDLYTKQIKGLDNSQRKISDGVKKSEVAAKDLEALSEQLVEFYAGMVRPPADQAGVPGVPGGVPGVPGVAGVSAAGVPGAVRPSIPGAPSVPGVPGATPAAAATPPEAAAALKKLQELQAKQQEPSAAPSARPGARPPARPAAGAGAGAAATEDPAEKLKRLREEAAEKLKKAKPGAAAARPAAGAAGRPTGAKPGAKRPGATADRPSPAKPSTSRPGAAASPTAKKSGSSAVDRLEELKRKAQERKSSLRGKKPSGGS